MIKVTLGDQPKQDEKPFPKLMVVKKGRVNEGTIVLFKEPKIGLLIRGCDYWATGKEYPIFNWNMNDFTDYNGPVTIQNA